MTRENEELNRVFAGRSARLVARWSLAIEVLCKELEERRG